MSVYFLQIADSHVDRGAQVNLQIDINCGSSIAQPDDFSTQRTPPESPVGCQSRT